MQVLFAGRGLTGGFICAIHPSPMGALALQLAAEAEAQRDLA